MNSDEIMISFRAYSIEIENEFIPDKTIEDDIDYGIDVDVKCRDYMERLEYKKNELIEKHTFRSTTDILKDTLYRLQVRINNEFREKYGRRRD